MPSLLNSVGRPFHHRLMGVALVAFCCCGCGGDEEAESNAEATAIKSSESGGSGGLGSLLGWGGASPQGEAAAPTGTAEAAATPQPVDGTQVTSQPAAATPGAATGEVATTTPEPAEYDPRLDPATWLEFTLDVPIYPSMERSSGFSFQDGQEFHNDGGWTTTDSHQQVYDWYLAELPRQGWTTGTTGYQGPRGVSRFEGSKGNRVLIVGISSVPSFGGNDGANEYLIHIKEVTYSR